jgi:hypothetical protein
MATYSEAFGFDLLAQAQSERLVERLKEHEKALRAARDALADDAVRARRTAVEVMRNLRVA